MVIPNTRTQEKIYSEQTGTYKSPWKWEQKHILLAIAFLCVVFWLCSSRIKKASWLPEVNKWLPLAGGLFFVGEKLFKLAQ